MDEKELKENDVSNDEELENDFVEVVEKEVEDNEELENSQTNNNYPNSTNKLTAIVYLIIFISIAIWVYFYAKQNPEMLNKILWKEETQTWTIETLSWNEDTIDTNSWINTDNTNLENIEDNNLIDANNSNNKNSSSSITGTTSTWSWEKTKEVLVDDFLKDFNEVFEEANNY